MPRPTSEALPTGAGSWSASSNRCWRVGCRAHTSPMPCCKRGSPPARTPRVRRWPRPSPPSTTPPHPNTPRRRERLPNGLLFEALDNVAARGGVGEALEAAGPGDLLGHAYEPAPGRTRQRAPDADAPDPELGEVAHGQVAREPHQEVDGLGRHRPHHSFDL